MAETYDGLATVFARVLRGRHLAVIVDGVTQDTTLCGAHAYSVHGPFSNPATPDCSACIQAAKEVKVGDSVAWDDHAGGTLIAVIPAPSRGYGAGGYSGDRAVIVTADQLTVIVPLEDVVVDEW